MSYFLITHNNDSMYQPMDVDQESYYDMMEIDYEEEIEVVSNPQVTLVSQSFISNASNVTHPITKQERQKFIIDGLNVLLYRSNGKKINNLTQLEEQVNNTLVPLLRCLASNKKDELPEVHLVMKGFKLQAENFNTLETCTLIMTCIQANLQMYLPITLYITTGTSEDSERDDRFCHILQMRYVKGGIIISNDKYRSLMEHCYDSVSYLKCNICFSDPMHVDMNHREWLMGLFENIEDPKNIRSTNAHGLDDTEVYSYLVDRAEYPHKFFSIEQGMAVLQ